MHYVQLVGFKSVSFVIEPPGEGEVYIFRKAPQVSKKSLGELTAMYENIFKDMGSALVRTLPSVPSVPPLPPFNISLRQREESPYTADRVQQAHRQVQTAIQAYREKIAHIWRDCREAQLQRDVVGTSEGHYYRFVSPKTQEKRCEELGLDPLSKDFCFDTIERARKYCLVSQHIFFVWP